MTVRTAVALALAICWLRAALAFADANRSPTSAVPARPLTVSNQTSIFAAPSLGAGNGAVAIYLGFPLLGIRGSVGVIPSLDLGLGFDSFYGAMNELSAHAKWTFYGGRRWAWALVVDGGRAFFTENPGTEGKGPRWITGRRDWNLAPGIRVSLRGAEADSARLFADVRCHLAFDTQPFQRNPLEGTLPPVQVSANLPVRLGAEVPLSSRTSFLFMFGFDLHGRVEDSTVMPIASMGVVAAI